MLKLVTAYEMVGRHVASMGSCSALSGGLCLAGVQLS